MYDRLTSIDFSSQKPDTFAVATENGLIKIFSIKQNFTNLTKTQKDSRSSETCELSNLGSFKFELVQKISTKSQVRELKWFLRKEPDGELSESLLACTRYGRILQINKNKSGNVSGKFFYSFICLD